MSIDRKVKHKLELHKALQQKGLRSTKQRSCVYQTIVSKQDHPTADDILLRVRKKLPSISLATIYNCLETLVDCGLIKQVNFDRSPTRFCPNLTPHAHFKCNQTGQIFDITLDKDSVKDLKSVLPKGFKAQNFELSFLGSTDQSLN